MQAVNYEDYFARIERDLMMGKGRWVADFGESFRNYRVRDVTFNLFIRGNTRVKGFLISRLYSFFVNPNYEVGCFVVETRDERQLDTGFMHKILAAARSCMDKNKMRWAWVCVLSNRLDQTAKHAVTSVKDKAIGVVAFGIEDRETVNTANFLGKQASKYFRPWRRRS